MWGQSPRRMYHICRRGSQPCTCCQRNFICVHAWPPHGQSLSAAAALFAIAVNMSNSGAPNPVRVANPVWVANPATSWIYFGSCMVNACLLLQPVRFLRWLGKGYPTASTEGGLPPYPTICTAWLPTAIARLAVGIL